MCCIAQNRQALFSCGVTYNNTNRNIPKSLKQYAIAGIKNKYSPAETITSVLKRILLKRLKSLEALQKKYRIQMNQIHHPYAKYREPLMMIKEWRGEEQPTSSCYYKAYESTS